MFLGCCFPLGVSLFLLLAIDLSMDDFPCSFYARFTSIARPPVSLLLNAASCPLNCLCMLLSLTFPCQIKYILPFLGSYLCSSHSLFLWNIPTFSLLLSLLSPRVAVPGTCRWHGPCLWLGGRGDFFQTEKSIVGAFFWSGLLSISHISKCNNYFNNFLHNLWLLDYLKFVFKAFHNCTVSLWRLKSRYFPYLF